MTEHWKRSAHILLIAVTVFLVLFTCLKNGRPAPNRLLKYTFCGEYSQDGGPWQPLEQGARLSALDGDLVLRGHFDQELPEGHRIALYLDHITYVVYMDDKFVSCSPDWQQELLPSVCAKYWNEFISPGISPENVVQIHLHNPHQFGNISAYESFLDSIYSSSDGRLRTALDREAFLYQLLGCLILILSIGVLGVAVTFSTMQESMSRFLWPLGLMALFASGYILLDIADSSLWSYQMAFNTCARQICIMMAALELGIFLKEYISSRARKVVQAVVLAEGVLLVAIMGLCLTGQVLIYDTLLVWVSAQLLFCPILLTCCIYERRVVKSWSSRMLWISGLLLAAVPLELVNLWASWWTDGVVIKSLFAVLFFVQLASGLKDLPGLCQKYVQTGQITGDQKNRNIVLATSQIKMHFVFNILNAISGMCKYDPEKADRTVILFARYLRTNLDTIQADQLIPFRTECKHLTDYIALEQIRFGDRIQFVTDLQEEDFLLPPLLLQPIVENAIKHGLEPKATGGTVVLRTRRRNNKIQISIQDDGVGFSSSALKKEQSIGLKNVRFRLYHLSRGTMILHSTPGKGTTVTISIPYKEATKCT